MEEKELMLSTIEKNDLLRKLEALNDAWETYVSDVAHDRQSRYGAGATVVARKEELIKFIKEELS